MSGRRFDLPLIILTLISVFLILFVGTAAMQVIVDSDPGGGEEYATPELGDNSWVTIANDHGEDETVYNSRGYGVFLTGADDSYYQTTDDLNIATGEAWSVSIWASVDDASAGETMAVTGIDGRIAIAYNGTTDEWVGWYYDEADRNSYDVSAAANTQPGTLENVVLVHDGGSVLPGDDPTLRIYANTNPGTSADLSESSTAEAPDTTSNWHGSVDEMRTFETPLDSDQRTALYENPVDPLPDTDRSLRLMFDEPDRTYQQVFFASGELATSNVEFVDALEGQEMSGVSFWNDLTGGTDYEWDPNGPSIRAVEDGDLDGAPVAYVYYQSQSNLDSWSDQWTSVVSMAGLLFVVLPLGAILVYLRAARSR